MRDGCIVLILKDKIGACAVAHCDLLAMRGHDGLTDLQGRIMRRSLSNRSDALPGRCTI
jgi:hypothetical protein